METAEVSGGTAYHHIARTEGGEEGLHGGAAADRREYGYFVAILQRAVLTSVSPIDGHDNVIQMAGDGGVLGAQRRQHVAD